ncbi:hypothetical protein Cgig2_030249 [Carnegiea gigantea]|uniref:CCHC-type domain-containing protein n=1 Tax=Carnegiea gigantea TaxID=171969 RepID=A0A9Q1JNQ4_9CARY|nr:hypothetical protein Cgig2_030249 [Carnegiea gigantea]
MSAERGRINDTDPQNVLFIHLSDGPGSLNVGEKLNRAGNYIAQRCSIEIGLSTKYKLVFLLGIFAKPADDLDLPSINSLKICTHLNKMAVPGNEEKCGVCGNKGHSKEKCWLVIGYPSWHPRSKKFPQKKTMATAHTQSDHSQGEANFGLTPQQIPQLLNLIPQQHKIQHSLSENDDELEQSFAGTVFFTCSSFNSCGWIIDTGVTDHIALNFEDLQGV